MALLFARTFVNRINPQNIGLAPVYREQNRERHTQYMTDDREVRHHNKLAAKWWDAVHGPMRALHSLNEIRVPFIRDGLVSRGHVLQQQKILEVGCGGGILTEALAGLGAQVTGIDLGEDLIQTAQIHLNEQSSELLNRITYKVQHVEEHAKEYNEFYDAVIVSEVIEHIDDKEKFLASCLDALKPNGSIFITTLNKTIPLWIGGILICEYALRIIPIGTHHWNMLISPEDLQCILNTMDCRTVMVKGSTYDFWRNKWRWVHTTKLVYALQAVKCAKKT